MILVVPQQPVKNTAPEVIPKEKETPVEKELSRQAKENPIATPENTHSTRGRRAAKTEKTSERWSQRRKRIQAKVKEEVKPKPIEEAPPVPEEMPELKPAEELLREKEPAPTTATAAPTLSPQVKKTRPPRRRKRGWVKGRSRQKPMKQLTLPDMVVKKVESESESILSEKSDYEELLERKKISSANHNSKEGHESKVKSKEDVKRTKRIKKTCKYKNQSSFSCVSFIVVNM